MMLGKERFRYLVEQLTAQNRTTPASSLDRCSPCASMLCSRSLAEIKLAISFLKMILWASLGVNLMNDEEHDPRS
jgi:hypothetical protein